MANISRDSYNESKNYDKVILQQGVPLPDYDFNEAQDIIRGKIRNIIMELFGEGAIQDGWQVIGTGASNNFTVKAGSAYRKGHRVILSADSTATELGLTLTTPASNRTDRVYLDVYEVEINSIADPDILHPKLRGTGIEPTRRIQVKADLKIAQGGSVPSDTSTHWYLHLADINRIGGNAAITSEMVVDRRTIAGVPAQFDTTTGHDHDGTNSKRVSPGNINTVVNQSITDTTSDNGTLSQMLSWIVKSIRAITGKADWKTAPATTLETAHTHITTTSGNPHNVNKSDVGLGNVDNESKATMFTNPTFTGTVSGVTKAHVGLANVEDKSAATIRQESGTPLRGEVVSSFPEHANGRIIIHTGEEKAFVSINGKWV